MAKTKTPPPILAPAEILSPEEWHALVVAAKPASKLRDRLEPAAAIAVDFTVRVTGTLSIGADQSSTVEQHPKAETLLGLVLSSLGPKTRETAIAACREACRDYLAGEDEPKPDHAKIAAQDLYEAVTRKETQNKRGSVTGIVKVERL